MLPTEIVKSKGGGEQPTEYMCKVRGATNGNCEK